jgi:hypothetical protein
MNGGGPLEFIFCEQIVTPPVPTTRMEAIVRKNWISLN